MWSAGVVSWRPRLEARGRPCHAAPVASTVGLAARILVVFCAGSVAGAAGLHWVTSAQMDAAKARSREAAARGSEPRQDDPSETAREDDGERVDREVLRRALRELLAEEGALPGSAESSLGSADSAPGEGISAAEVLAGLERAYQAALASQRSLEEAARLAASLNQTSQEDGREQQQDGPELDGARAMAEASRPTEAAEPVRRSAEEDEAQAVAAEPPPEPERPQRVAARSKSIDEAPAPTATGTVREHVQVHNGDVTQVDARQTAVVQQIQPIFLYAPYFAGASPRVSQPAPGARNRTFGSPGQSPLSRPSPSAHEQSPWSPIDYSLHHNPWGSTFGRRIP